MADFFPILAIIGCIALFIWDDKSRFPKTAKRDELQRDTYRAIQTQQLMDAETLDTMKALMQSAQTYGYPSSHNNLRK